MRRGDPRVCWRVFPSEVTELRAGLWNPPQTLTESPEIP